MNKYWGGILKNRVFVSGNVAVIEAYNRPYDSYFYIIIDSADMKILENHATSVFAAPDSNTIYALYQCKAEKRVKKIHRLLMQTPKGLEVDHKNHNGLDNRRINLRNCTRLENARNRRKYGTVKNPF